MPTAQSRSAKLRNRHNIYATDHDLCQRMVNELHRCGLRNALVSLKNARFTTYLRRPASLLRENWNFESGSDTTPDNYTILGAKGTRQRLYYNRDCKVVVLETTCPNLGKIQRINYCVKARRVLSNQIMSA